MDLSAFNLREQIKKSNDAWQKIDEIIPRLKTLSGRPHDDTIDDIVSLLLILTEQLRPIGNIGEQAEKLQNEISGMFDSLIGDKK